jgi:hypothetical protein|tara:strand:+ start:73 stop:765 length:693 start_codon:yes stop_codon:yes gene_type:complete
MKTYDYNAFTMNFENRNIYKKNVDAIKESILQVGFIEERAIIVDEYLKIIDGHHRFFALSQLKLPIYYEIRKNATTREMLFLNSAQRSWSLFDYIELYAKECKPFYTDVIELINNSSFNSSMAMVVCSKDNHSLSKKIRLGDYIAVNEKKEELIDLILYSKTQIPFYGKRHFALALKAVLKQCSSLQIEKIKNNLSSMREQTSTTNYLITFENIINKGLNAGNRINLTNK